MTALSISPGTLSPTFDRGLYNHTAEVPSDTEVITLAPTVLTGYQMDFVSKPGWGVVSACNLWRPADCTYSYGDGRTIGLDLSDADAETEGFQVNLNRGENRLGIGVNRGSVGPGPGKLYVLTITVQNASATGQPAITGSAQVGQTLAADTSEISDDDGLDNVSYRYHWLADDAEIGGATSSSYTLQSSDNGKVIKVRVTFTDDAGYEESLTSEGTAAVVMISNTPVHASSAPDLEVGTPSVNDATLYTGNSFTLSVTVTNVGDGASEATTLRYYRSTDSTITTSDTAQGSESVGALAAAGASDHDGGMTAPSEAGTYHYGACADSVTDESDTTDNCSSSVTVTVSEPAPDLAVLGIDVTYGVETGERFRIGVTVQNLGDGQSAETTLRWLQAITGVSDTELGTDAIRALNLHQANFETIRLTAPSTPGTYTYKACVDPVAGESDTTNNCRSVTITTTNNLATGVPIIGGTVRVGETLTVDTSGITDEDGLENVSYSYQWLVDDAEISGATGASYTLVPADVGKAISIGVTFTDDAGNLESVASDPT